MKEKIFLIVAWLSCISSVIAQTPFFKKGSRVCFVGNSITHNGEFHHNILQYYITRFPKQPVQFFNCGIAGDITGGILQRIDDDVMVNKPTHVVVMIGMNDIKRDLYSVGANPSQVAKQKEALQLYKKNLDSIVRIFLSRGVTVLLQKPSPYDQTAQLDRPNAFGANDALHECANYMQQLADKYQLNTIDYWTLMTNVTNQLQKNNAKATLTVGDRIHPNSTGHMLMAYEFLKSTNATPYVANIAIDAQQLQNHSSNINCKVKKVVVKKDVLTATILENALPFPSDENQKYALSLVPFTETFNRENLQIQKLPKGRYLLMIDTTVVDTFSSEALQQGINLVNYPQTPQNQQAILVRNELTDLWNIEANLRAVKYIGFQHLRTYAQKNDIAATKRYLDSLYEHRFKGQAWYATNFQKYLQYQPQVKTLLLQANILRKRIYQLAQPTKHTFILKKLEDNNTVDNLIAESQAGAMPLYFDVASKSLLFSIDTFSHPNEAYTRGGLPHFFNKINHNTSLTVGFIGGSITRANNQYRSQTLSYIQSINPSCKVKGINAGVSGAGADLGVCRLNEQILKYRPDLVFIEFAVNGGSMDAIEGMVRQIWKSDPTIDVCFIYTIAGEQYKIYARGEVPAFIQSMEKLAEHYQIPSVHMGLYPSILEQRGLLAWKAGAAVNGKAIFSNDGVHPTETGGNMYAQSLARALQKFSVAPTSTMPHNIVTPYSNRNWEDAGMYAPLQVATFTPGWQTIKTEGMSHLEQFAPWFSNVLKANKAGEGFSFRFKGTGFGIFDIGGPDVGQLEIEVDGKPFSLNNAAASTLPKEQIQSPNLLNRFNVYCNNRYRGQYELFSVPLGEHTVKMTISATKADKAAILGLANLTDFTQNPDKYNQQAIYIGRILIRGEILK